MVNLNNIHKLGLIGFIIATLASIALETKVDPTIGPFWKSLLWLIIIIAISLIGILLLAKKEDKKRRLNKKRR